MNASPEDTQRRRLVSSPLKAEVFTPAAALVSATFGARSHRGRERQENDDHYLVLRLTQRLETMLTSLANADLSLGVDEHAYAAVVADGIGPAGSGSVAARLAISTLAHLAVRSGQWHLRMDPRIAADVIEHSEWLYRRTNEAVLRRSHAEAQLVGMTAALTGIYSVGDDLFVAHVGHSRCYLFRDGLLAQLTRDHTLSERVATSPFPIPIGAAIEDVKHVLTRVIGTDVRGSGATIEQFRLRDHDTLLLCTNGLTDVVSDDAIADVLALRRDDAETCDQLVDLALANGADDNATAVIVNYQVAEQGSGTA